MAGNAFDIQGEGIAQGEAHGGTLTGGGISGDFIVGSNTGNGVNWTMVIIAAIGGLFLWLLMTQPRRRR
jgi:hypothetical protein